MEKRKSLINVLVAITFKIILLILTFITRRYLILFCGNEINGLNSLFLSIIGVLAVAELGIGTAITFCMYEPIANKETSKVVSLYCLFKKLYLRIGLFILVGGLIISPFLTYFVNDYKIEFVDIACFIVVLVSTFISYLFSAKSSLINAYKNNYITTTITSICTILLNIMQIIILFITKQYLFYVLMRVITVCLQYYLTGRYTKKHHYEIVLNFEKIDPITYAKVKKNIGAMFIHKIGITLIISFNSIIISIFLGVEVLGHFSNYLMIMTAMVSLIVLFINPLLSIIGYYYVKESKENNYKMFNFLYLINYCIGFLFFLGYYAIVNDIIILWLGKDFVIEKSVVLVICISYFIDFTRTPTKVYRDATGTFYNDRYRPIVEGIINLSLSLLLVLKLGELGVLLSNIITFLLIACTVEPHILIKNAFEKRSKNFIIKNYSLISVFIVFIYLFEFVKLSNSIPLYSLILNGVLSVFITLIVILIIYLIFPEFRKRVSSLIKQGYKKLRKM